MLKQATSVKEIERLGAEAIKALFQEIPVVDLHSVEIESPAQDQRADLVASVDIAGKHYVLVCEAKQSGQPRYIRDAIYQLRDYLREFPKHATPVVIAPYLSPESRELCFQNGVSFLDLEGNARLVFGTVFIDRVRSNKPAPELRELRSLLMEIGQILGGFNGKYAVIGGAVPWLLLDNHEMPHVGTLDVDLGLDAEALGEGEYARLVETLMGHDYKQSPELRKFQLVRTITLADGGIPIDVIVDFLMPRDAVIEKNKPPIVEDFAVQRADGADLALHLLRTQLSRRCCQQIARSTTLLFGIKGLSSDENPLVRAK